MAANNEPPSYREVLLRGLHAQNLAQEMAKARVTQVEKELKFIQHASRERHERFQARLRAVDNEEVERESYVFADKLEVTNVSHGGLIGLRDGSPATICYR